MEYIKLNNDLNIPAIGFGTWRSTEEDGYNSVRHALKAGYTHIDTAEIYANEYEVGRALSDSGVNRKEVFVTTKLWNSHSTREEAEQALVESLEKLGTDYVDLYLIHWPGTYERIRDVWTAMEAGVDAGKVRAIGVSNFNAHHINMLLESARIKPVINQVECHVHLQNVFLQKFCAQKGIVLQAYAPLNSDRIGELLSDETLRDIAASHGKTIPQVALRWLVQRGIVALPKSTTPSRIEENLDIFDFSLSEAEMKLIRSLNRGKRAFPEPDNMDFGFSID